MSFDTREVYEAFGMEMPQTADGTADEAGAPADVQLQQEQAENAGAKEQEIAEPAQQEPAAEGGQPVETEADGDTPPQEPDKQPMPPEKRRENAARRRKKELDDAVNAAVAKERAAADEKIRALLETAKLTSPYTGKVISTEEELKEYLAQDRQARIERDLKAGKLTMEALQEAAKAAIPEKQAPEQPEEPETQVPEDDAAFRTQVQQELAEIGKLNPKVKTIHDILQMETGERFAQLVQKNGLSFLDAYKLANEDALRQQTAAAAAQAAKTAAATKQHLQASTKRGMGALTVPDAEMQYYRAFFPGKSDAEIQTMYNERMKSRRE